KLKGRQFERAYLKATGRRAERSCGTLLLSAILLGGFHVHAALRGIRKWTAANRPHTRSTGSMSVRPVHWEEGMFFLPQHLQAAQRHGTHFAQLGDKWNLHYSWGLRSCEVDAEALGNYRFVVRSLEARLRDGTLIAVPENGVLPAVELKAAFQRSAEV